jgi:hypothetical protein
MIDEIAGKLSFANNGNGEYVSESGLCVRFFDKKATITETLDIEDEYNKITALTYASGGLGDAYLATDGKGLFFVPEYLLDMRLRIVVVHIHAPTVSVLRPIKVLSIRYQSDMTSPEELVIQNVNYCAINRFPKPEIKNIYKSDRMYIYTATSFEDACEEKNKESMLDMFNREPVDEREEIIISELKKIYQASDLQQACSTLLHEENHPAHPLDE